MALTHAWYSREHGLRFGFSTYRLAKTKEPVRTTHIFPVKDEGDEWAVEFKKKYEDLVYVGVIYEDSWLGHEDSETGPTPHP